MERERMRALEAAGLLRGGGPPELDDICRRARGAFGVATAMVTVVTRDRIVAKGRAGTEFEEAPREGLFCDRTIRTDEVFVLPDARADWRYAQNPIVTADPFVRFYAGAPLIHFRRVRLGALCLLDPTPRDLSRAERGMLAGLAEEAAAAIAMEEIDRTAVSLGLGAPRLA